MVLLLSLATAGARAGEPPKKMPAAASASLKTALMFPSPSELATRLKTAGIRVAPGTKVDEKVPAPGWPKLAPLDRQLQLGSVLGYLAFSAAASDMPAVGHCLDQVLPAVETLGVAKSSTVYAALGRLRDGIKSSQVSETQVMAGLDDLRRETLREIATRTNVKDLTFVMAAAWLRGSALLARQVTSDTQAVQLAEFVMRPELIEFIGRVPGDVGSGGAPERRMAAEQILALAKKKSFKRGDFDSFVALVDTFLKPPKVTL